MTVVAAPIIPTGKNLESLRELRNLTFSYKDNQLNIISQLFQHFSLAILP
jgi:hypothetical protein